MSLSRGDSELAWEQLDQQPALDRVIQARVRRHGRHLLQGIHFAGWLELRIVIDSHVPEENNFQSAVDPVNDRPSEARDCRAISGLFENLPQRRSLL